MSTEKKRRKPEKTTETGFTQRISKEYYNLTAAEKKAADYVVAHRAEAQNLSITELAAASDVAEATISRFVRRLKYKGYNEFRLDIARSVTASSSGLSPLSGEVTDGDSFSEIIRKIYTADVDAITQTLELIDERKIKQAADMIEQADKVFCMGQGGSMIIAQEAAHLFTTTQSKYFAVTDNHTQAITASTMTERDAVLYFSYSGATTDMMHTLSIVRNRGAGVILITRFPNAPGAKLADVVLQCGSNESPLQLGSVAARISQMYLLDVLFSEVCLRNLDDCRQARMAIAEALTDKHL